MQFFFASVELYAGHITNSSMTVFEFTNTPDTKEPVDDEEPMTEVSQVAEIPEKRA